MGSSSLKRIFLRYGAVVATAVISFAGSTNAPVTLSSAPSIGVALFRMLGSLAVVIAVFLGGVWVFRNLHRFKAPGATPRKLQVLEGKSLGPRQAVYVVAYEQQRLLIGATAQGISLLTHLPDGTPQPEADRIVPVSFGEALMQALGRK